MIVFRVALRKYAGTPREAFSGVSGFNVDGRWHSRGRYLDYVAENKSLAALERLVHYKRLDLLAPHVLFVADIPNEHIESVLAIPADWNRDDLSPAAQEIGDTWYDEARSVALQVPSVVTPGEHNFIVNCRHPAWNWSWVLSGPERFAFDYRLSDLVKLKRSPAA